ncbi:MAG: ribosome-associated translation inhibitor RaiA [Planctomycetaceae bacterium]|nr:ribosome-associated translation inhibitor RaiA [Planctomycetaceae bacterium]MCA9110204.1 ribosome-associated translation inhibitor RaiA [Planctomycetaceae bacterium]
MQVAITCRHGEIPNDVREYIAQKAEKLLNYFERVTAINVTLDFESDRVTSEIIVDTEHKHDFVSKDTGSDTRATFDSSLHKMEQQIRKYKQKLQDHRRDQPTNALTEAVVEEEPEV